MTRSRYLLAAAAGLAAFLVPGAAQAPPFCTTSEALTAALTTRYGERVVAMGLTTGGDLIQLFTRPDDATWTILLTRATGQSCLVAAGRDWLVIADPPGTSRL